MKYSIAVKFLVICLTACSLVSAMGGAAGIVALESADLYINGLEDLQEQVYDSIGRTIASDYAERYAVEQLGDVSYAIKQDRFPNPADRADAEYWTVKLVQGDEVLVEPSPIGKSAFSKTYTVAPQYPIMINPDKEQPETEETQESTETTNPDSTEPEEPVVPEGYLYKRTENIWEGNGWSTYEMYYYQAPTYSVTIYMLEAVLESSSMHLLNSIYPYRFAFIAVLAGGLLLFAAGVVYLCWIAGRVKDGSVRPGGLSRLPLDLTAVLACGGITALILLFVRIWDWVEYEGPHPGNLSIIGVNLFGITLLLVVFVYIFAAQIKVKGGFWWRNTVIGWLCRMLAALFRTLAGAVENLIRLLPVIWQWLLVVGVMAVSILVLAVFSISGGAVIVCLLVADIILCIGAVLYGGYAFGTLMMGAKKMSQGELSHKIPAQYLVGSFRDFAQQLNDLSQTAMIAAEKEMRSERMKTELITNVSHDIKTPLTSIINFVDLLQKPHTAEESEQYLEVLSRQAGRMKKLIEDLMELSRANSGNIAVNIVTMDAQETVNQALGEFSDKLDAVELIPVFHAPETPIMMQADGRLVWRVLSNTLSNAVKYAMPGTRLYIDLLQVEDRVLLSLKNISREELNVSAEELMERFVRGDTSRNSEGSGLGLNIAKSLMEIQNGQMTVLLDGDLFKVTLIFPAAQETENG